MKRNTIQAQLQSLRVTALSAHEQERVWKHVRKTIATPLVSSKRARRSKISTLKKSLVVSLIFGLTAGTAFAADNAKPGDRLFTLDRALENIQLSFASAGRKDELNVKFALERVTEVKEILREISILKTDTSIKTSFEPTAVEQTPSHTTPVPPEELPGDTANAGGETEQPSLKGAVPTVEGGASALNSEKKLPEELMFSGSIASSSAAAATSTPNTTATGTENITESAVVSSFPETLPIPTDISEGDKKRIELALGTALSFLGDVKGELMEQGNNDAVSYIDFMLEQLNADIDTLPADVTFEVGISAKKKGVHFQITSKDSKSKVQIEVAPKPPLPLDTPEKQSTGIPAKSKLHIKDGALTITNGKTEVTDNKTNQTISEKEGLVTAQHTGTSTPEMPIIVATSSVATSSRPTTGTSTASTQENPQKTNAEQNNSTSSKDDGTTTVKVIIKKLKEDFELSVTDQNAGIHDIIEGYTDTGTGGAAGQ